MSNFFESALAQAEASPKFLNITHWGYVNQHAAGITIMRVNDGYENELLKGFNKGESTLVVFAATGGDDILANLIFNKGSQDEDQLFFDRSNILRAGLMYDLLVRRITPLLASSHAYFYSPNSGVVFIIEKNGVKYAYRQTFRMHAKGVIEKNDYLTLNDAIDMTSVDKYAPRLCDTLCPCVVCDERRTFGRLLSLDERTERAKRLEAAKPSITKM